MKEREGKKEREKIEEDKRREAAITDLAKCCQIKQVSQKRLLKCYMLEYEEII